MPAATPSSSSGRTALPETPRFASPRSEALPADAPADPLSGTPARGALALRVLVLALAVAAAALLLVPEDATAQRSRQLRENSAQQDQRRQGNALGLPDYAAPGRRDERGSRPMDGGGYGERRGGDRYAGDYDRDRRRSPINRRGTTTSDDCSMGPCSPGNPPEAPQVPLGGLEWLALAGGAYAMNRLRERGGATGEEDDDTDTLA